MSTDEKVFQQDLLHVLLSGSIPKDILDDLSSRFIINVPEEERKDVIRICFQIELAHWFYLDFYCPENTMLKPCGIREFAKIIFNHVPSLKEHAIRVDEIVNQWREYKMAVPTYGAIMLDESMENVLLVQSYFAKASWSFPKGKVNEEEEPHSCAVREVLEETGFDIEKLINKKDFIENHIRDQLTRLYIIVGVPGDFQFKPLTRNEIKGFKWFPIYGLPTTRRDNNCKVVTGFGANAFFMVIPFIKGIRKWILGRQQKLPPSSSGIIVRRPRSKTIGDGLICASIPEKSVQQQQQYFATMCQNSYAEFLQVVNDGNSKVNTYSPPPRMQKLKGQKAHNQKKMQDTLVKRSTAQQANGKKSPNSKNIMEKKEQYQQQFTSTAWKCFKFDRAAVMSAFY